MPRLDDGFDGRRLPIPGTPIRGVVTIGEDGAMTQQPFSRPGAIDLSGLSRPAASSAPAGSDAATGSAYAVQVAEQNFQQLLESSMAAPVLLVFYSHSRMPESAQLADDMATVAGEYDGRFLVGLVDIDAV